jgi:hypothetical protein
LIGFGAGQRPCSQSWASGVDQLAVLFFSEEAGFDQVAHGAVLVELGSAFLQRGGLPERTQSR